MENKNDIKLGFFTKLWYSITKFEKYPKMASEGVRRAISYLMKLMMIFSIIVVLGLMYNFNIILNECKEYLNENISIINYEKGELNIEPKDGKNIIIDIGDEKVIIDTNANTIEDVKEYDNTNKSNNTGIFLLKNKLVLCTEGVEQGYSYINILNGIKTTSFNKENVINYLNDYKIYLSFFIIMVLLTFLAYLIATIVDVLVLSIFGLLTTILLRIKIRYRAIFNMSIYSLSISILLKMIYVTLNMFIDFKIKYFNFMYSAIGYICLVASIFMLKSDIIKQQMELIRIANEEKQKQEEKEKEKERQKQEEKEKKENADKKNKKDKKEKKEPEVEENDKQQGQEA